LQLLVVSKINGLAIGVVAVSAFECVEARLTNPAANLLQQRIKSDRCAKMQLQSAFGHHVGYDVLAGPAQQVTSVICHQ